MKKKIAWVTDSTAFIPDDMDGKEEIHVVPLSICFGNETFEDGVDLSPDQLYERLHNSPAIPKTSQPSVGKFVQLYEKLKIEYECAIAVHISSKLSGTLNGSRQAAEMAGFPVEVVDSKLMSYPITTLIKKGMKLSENHFDFQKIASLLREEAEKFENYILVGSLDQFYKGGRMSGVQYFLGNLLQIKPIIQIKDGIFEVYEKVRTEGKAIKRILEQLDEAKKRNPISSVQILHGNVLEKALSLKERIQEKYHDLSIVVCPISSTIGVHAGEGTLAIAWMNEKTVY